jgi:antitoxin component of MazEF toxin-antitoxin module
MFNKLIKLIHVNIGKNLRSQVADGHSFVVGVKKRQNFYSLSLSLSLS